MKSLWNAMAIILLVNLLALIAGVGWLRSSGRLDADRVKQVVAMFKPTIAQQARLEAEAEQVAAQAAQRAEEVARLEAAAKGPANIDTRIADSHRADELAQQTLARSQREFAALRQRIESDKALLKRRWAQLQQAQEAFAKRVAQQMQQQKDQDFKRAVAMYENLKGKQAKQMFLKLIAQGQEDQVVSYLAAMELRKASGVLKEFKTDPELAIATMLVEKLRQRGVDLTQDMPDAMKQAVDNQLKDQEPDT